MFIKYVNLLNYNNYELEYYKKVIKSHFYIIKEMIFQEILFDISLYDENNVLKFSQSYSEEGNCFDMKIIHANIKNRHLIKIEYLAIKNMR